METIRFNFCRRNNNILYFIYFTSTVKFGLAKLSIKAVRGEESSFSELFDGFNDFGRIWVSGVLKILITIGIMIPAYIVAALFMMGGAMLLDPVIGVIPGIIALYVPLFIVMLMLSQNYHILVDDSQIESVDSLKKSRSIMNGYKWKLLWLFLLIGLIATFCMIPYIISYVTFMMEIDAMQSSGNFQDPTAIFNNMGSVFMGLGISMVLMMLFVPWMQTTLAVFYNELIEGKPTESNYSNNSDSEVLDLNVE